MTSSQFTQLSRELCSVVGFIPFHWEFVQNDELDSLLNIFPIKSYEELESKITHTFRMTFRTISADDGMYGTAPNAMNTFSLFLTMCGQIQIPLTNGMT